MSDFGTNRIKGIDDALKSLPNKEPEQLSPSEIDPIRKILLTSQHERGQSFGRGNGWELTYSINTYLVEFFNTFLKNGSNVAFRDCLVLSKNTYIKCGRHGSF